MIDLIKTRVISLCRQAVGPLFAFTKLTSNTCNVGSFTWRVMCKVEEGERDGPSLLEGLADLG